MPKLPGSMRPLGRHASFWRSVAILFALIVAALAGCGAPTDTPIGQIGAVRPLPTVGGGTGASGPAGRPPAARCVDYDPALLPGLTKAPEDSTVVVGSIPAHFAVDDDGIATYRMPIWAPPAHGGAAPALSLSYRSDGGDGPLGLGFSFDGVSSIRPCPHNLADDGENEPPTFGPVDHFCLDGRKMVLLSGTYGQDAEYRLVPDTFTRIRSDIRQPGAPPRFTVWTKDGRTAIYEPKQVLAMPNGGMRVRSYGITNERDANGHETHYVYATLKRESAAGPYDAEVRLDRIDYGFASAASNDPAYTIQVEYEERPDPRELYSRGFAVELLHRVSRIVIRARDTELRRYLFGYESAASSSGRSRLGSVEVCAGTSCMRPTNFSWTTSQPGIDPSDARTIKSETLLDDAQFPFLGDFDGDGRTDFTRWGWGVLTHSDTPGSAYTTAVWHEGPVNTAAVTVDVDQDGRMDLLARPSPVTGGNLVWSHFDGKKFVTELTNLEDLVGLQSADLNGDGRRDIFGCDGTQWVARLGQPGGWFGKAEVIAVMPPGEHVGDDPDSPCSVRMVVLDADGDGDSDILATRPPSFFSPTQAVIIRHTAKGFVARPSGMTDRLERQSRTAKVIDLNGDGLHDLIAFDSAPPNTDPDVEFDTMRTRVWINTGDGFRLVGPMPLNASDARQLGVVLDWDGDGREDVLYAPDPGTNVDAKALPQRVLLSKGDGSWASKETGLLGVGELVVDANGDGLPDLLRAYKVGWCLGTDLPCAEGVKARSSYQVYLHRPALDPKGEPTSQPPDRIVAIREGTHQGNGVPSTVELSYAPLTDSSRWGDVEGSEPIGSTAPGVFRRCWDAGKREGCFVGARHVVAEEVHDAGGTGLPESRKIIRHRYEAARYDHDGRGNIGFALHKLRTAFLDAPLIDGNADAPDSIDIVRELDQTFVPLIGRYPFAGRMKRESITIPLKDGTTREMVREWNWDVQLTAASYFNFEGGETALERRRKKTVSKTVARSSVVRTMDEFGSVVQETSKALVDAEADVWESGSVSRVVENDTAGDHWYLGLVKTETAQMQGDPPRTRVFEYDAAGRLVKETSEPDSATLRLVTTIGRDAAGNVSSVVSTGATGGTRRTCITYTPDGMRPFAQTDSLGHTVTFRFGLAGELLGVRDPNGRDSLMGYDAFLRPVVQVSPGNVVSQRQLAFAEPNKDGFTATTISNNGARSVAIHDRFGRQLTALGFAVKGNDGRLASTGLRYFDARGRVVSSVHPQLEGEAPQTDTFTYDNDGRLLQQKDADGIITGYANEWDSLVVATSEQWEGGLRTTKVRRDSRGRIVEVRDAKGSATTYVWRPNGTLKSVTGPGGTTTTTEVDELGRVVVLNDPSSGVSTTTYDAFGQVVRRTTADGAEVTMTYDNGGRVRTRTDADGLSRFLYDPPGMLGALRRTESADGVNHEYRYDSLGRLERVRTEADGESYDITYGYDAVSQIDRVEYPAVGPTPFVLRYWRDPYAHVTRITQEVPGADARPIWWKLDETAAGQTVNELFGNETGTQRQYDPQTNRLSSVLTVHNVMVSGEPRPVPRAIQALAYTHDKAGNLKTRTDYLQGAGADQDLGVLSATGETERFTYDSLDRLIRAKLDSAPQPRYEYEYDTEGNLKAKKDVGTYTYEPSRPHVLVSAGAVTYQHDVLGRMTQRGPDTLTYTAANQLRTVTTGGKTTAYRYDTRHTRVVTDDASSHTVRVGGLYERRVSKQNLLAKPATVRHRYFVPTPERTIAIAEETTTLAGFPLRGSGRAFTYLHADHLGSPDVLTNEAGAVVERQSFDPFGARRDARWTSTAAPKAPRFEEGFTGHEDDPAGLVNARGRSYDPRLGRFVSPDPVVQAPFHAPSLHRYSYVWNNPMTLVDPSGFEVASTQPDGTIVFADDPLIGSAPKPPDPEPTRVEAPVESPATHQSEPSAAPDALSAFQTEFVDDLRKNVDGMKETADLAASHPIATGIAVGYLPVWAGPALAAGVVLTVNDASDAYARNGLGGLGGYLAGEVTTQAALAVATKGAGNAASGVSKATAKVMPAIKQIAVAPGMMLMGTGVGGGRVPRGAFDAARKTLQTARAVAAKLPDEVKCLYKCAEFAEALQAGLKEAGVSGARIEIQVGKGITPYSDTVGALAQPGRGHHAILVGDTVFDNMRTSGIPYTTFIEDLGGKQFFDTPFVSMTQTPFLPDTGCPTRPLTRG